MCNFVSVWRQESNKQALNIRFADILSFQPIKSMKSLLAAISHKTSLHDGKRGEVFAPTPRPFDFGFTARRPLVPLPAVSMFLDLTAKEVLALIEEGKLRWAFDIRTAHSGRREVRVLRQSLFEFTGLCDRPRSAQTGDAAEFREISELILPKGVLASPAGVTETKLETAPKVLTDLPLKICAGVKTLPKVLFASEPVLRGTEVAQCFSCISQHVLNLLREKSLESVNLRCGPKASPLIIRRSLVHFLETRRMS
jgi:hypothetical protein